MMEKFKDYVLIEKIGMGGMAEVYQAVKMGVLGIERVVALKRVLPQFSGDERFTRMFMREGKIALQLQHPNIVATYDFGVENGIYYLAMEFVEGWDLKSLMRQVDASGETLPLAATIYIIQSVLKGLDYAHNLKDMEGKPLNIVHRDVSPGNIMINKSGTVKISDFGVARATTGDFTLGTSIAGKVSYLSPEMVEGKIVDRRADIFSVGIIFIEMLTGEKLFTGGEFEIMRMIREGYAEDFVKKSKFPEPLKEILLRAVATRRDERYSTAGEFVTDLNNFVFKHLFQNVEEEFKEFLSSFEPVIKLRNFDREEVERIYGGVSGKEAYTPRKRKFPVTALVVLLLILLAGGGYYFLKFGSAPSFLAGNSVVSSKVESPLPRKKKKEVVPRIAVVEEQHKERKKTVKRANTVHRKIIKEKKKEPVPAKKRVEKVTPAPAVTPPAAEQKKPPAERRTETNGASVVEKENNAEEKKSVSEVQPVDTETEKKEIVEDQTETTAMVEKKPGYLTIVTIPWANIYIDGKDAGTTPIFRKKLKAGKHTITLFSPQLGVEKKLELEIQPGKELKKRIKLEVQQ